MNKILRMSEESLLTVRNKRIVNRIINNINEKKQIQTVYGDYFEKLVSYNWKYDIVEHFLSQGLRVLCCINEERGYPLVKIEGSHFYCNEFLIGGENPKDYDIIIIDAPANGFDRMFIDEESEYRAFTYLQEFLAKAITIQDISIICFENYSKQYKGTKYVPIVATEQMLMKENIEDIYPEYICNLKREFSNLKKEYRKLENNVFRNNKTKSKSKICCSVGSSTNAKDEIEELRKEINFLKNIIFKMEKHIENIDERVESIEEKIIKTSKALDKGWNNLQIYVEINEKIDLEKELFIKKIIDKVLSEQQMEFEHFCAMKEYQEIENDICCKLKNDVWRKMSDESKCLVVTANLYEQNLWNYKADGSSICMLLSKAFEIELARRFVDGYLRYLREIGMKKNEFPTGILQRKNGKETILKYEDFTLGHCPYIMGRVTKVGENKMQKQKNEEIFLEYCAGQLLRNQDMNDIKKWIRKYDSYIRHVKEKYRNPAAHKGKINSVDALKCMEFLIGVNGKGEAVMVEMLNDFWQ